MGSYRFNGISSFAFFMFVRFTQAIMFAGQTKRSTQKNCWETVVQHPLDTTRVAIFSSMNATNFDTAITMLFGWFAWHTLGVLCEFGIHPTVAWPWRKTFVVTIFACNDHWQMIGVFSNAKQPPSTMCVLFIHFSATIRMARTWTTNAFKIV